MVYSPGVGGAFPMMESRYRTRKAQFSGSTDEKNAVLSQLLSDPTHESPPKRMKITMGSPIKRRSFGEVIDGNNILDAANISMLSMESKDTAGTQLTEDTASDCATEVTSVAALRGWLDDFGKNAKTHYVKNTVVGKQLEQAAPLEKTPEQAAMEKPTNANTNPRVVIKSVVPSTPLPPQAPLAIKRIIVDPKKQMTTSASNKPPELPLERPTRPRVSRSITAQPPTPLPLQAASAIKRIINDPKKQTANSAGGLSRIGMTPIRMKPTYNKNEIQATNTTIASVAKLSAWLADDPTTTKKVKQIRRGANVIAKSRKFDKGLANVIVEQNNIRPGSVASKKQWLLEFAASEDSTDDNASLASASDRSSRKHWLDGPGIKAGTATNDSASTLSVSDKKAWLSNAFNKRGGTNALAPKARTDVITGQEERDDLSSRAKQMWRDRAPSNRDATVVRNPMKHVVKERSPMKKRPTSEAFRPQSEMKPKPDARREIATRSPTRRFSVQLEQPVNFHAARDLIVERSKTNGNGVEVLSKVKIRQAKFERLGKESRRQSAPLGLLKPSWDDADTEEGPSNSYVKKFVDDIAPKKSFEELP